MLFAVRPKPRSRAGKLSPIGPSPNDHVAIAVLGSLRLAGTVGIGGRSLCAAPGAWDFLVAYRASEVMPRRKAAVVPQGRETHPRHLRCPLKSRLGCCTVNIIQEEEPVVYKG